MKKDKIIIAYIPVLHNGYKLFFEKYPDASLFILANDLIDEFDHLAKEIRALSPEDIKKAVDSWGIFKNIEILNIEKIKSLKIENIEIILPKEDVMLKIWDKYFPRAEVFLDNIFLRWDKHNTITEKIIAADKQVSQEKFDREMMNFALLESKKTSDWWRAVGCVLVKDSQVVVSTYNKHVPSEHICYINGDPRNNFYKGVHVDLGTSIHAEAGAIAMAAKNGISLSGASIYVSTFPCPACAKLIAYSGVKKIYYFSGYSMLDGESILKQNGVEIIQVVGL